jgi:hypothetical protein
MCKCSLISYGCLRVNRSQRYSPVMGTAELTWPDEPHHEPATVVSWFGGAYASASSRLSAGSLPVVVNVVSAITNPRRCGGWIFPTVPAILACRCTAEHPSTR